MASFSHSYGIQGVGVCLADQTCDVRSFEKVRSVQCGVGAQVRAPTPSWGVSPQKNGGVHEKRKLKPRTRSVVHGEQVACHVAANSALVGSVTGRLSCFAPYFPCAFQQGCRPGAMFP